VFLKIPFLFARCARRDRWPGLVNSSSKPTRLRPENRLLFYFVVPLMSGFGTETDIQSRPLGVRYREADGA